MSNSRSFRRKSRVAAIPDLPERRPPWNKGLSLTATPSVSTERRWLKMMEAAGAVEHVTDRTGKPGRPPHLWSVTKTGWALYDIFRLLESVGFDTRVLSSRQADVLISAGYAARRDDGTIAFLGDYQAWWKYWNSKKGAGP